MHILYMKGRLKGPVKDDIISAASSEDGLVLLGEDHAIDPFFVAFERRLQVSGLQIPLLHLAVEAASCTNVYICIYV